MPHETTLELNEPGHTLAPSTTAEELLLPLLQAAAAQERWGLDGDLVQRTRGAGAFRSAYLPTAPQDEALVGLIAFPTDHPELHVVVLRVAVAVRDDRGVHTAVWTLD